MEVSDQMTDMLYDLFNRRWDSCRPNYLRSDGVTRWSFLLDQLGVKKISTANADWKGLSDAKLEQKIVIPDPGCIGPYGHLIVPRELAEKILVLGHIP